MTVTQEILKQLHASRQIVEKSIADGRALLDRGHALLADKLAPFAAIRCPDVIETIHRDNRKLSGVIDHGAAVLAEIGDLIAVLNIYQTGNETGATGPVPEFPAFNDPYPNNSGFGENNAINAQFQNAQQEQQRRLYTVRDYPCGCRAGGSGDVPKECMVHGAQTPKEPSLADLKAHSANERATRAAKGTDLGNGMMAFDSFEDALDYALDNMFG